MTFLRHPDGEVEVSIPFRRELALVIRQRRPDVILTFDPWQRYQIHPDHRAVGQTTLDAVAAARDHLYYPEQLSDEVREHRVHNVYCFATDYPNYYVDITSTIDLKIEALRCHTSQIRSEGLAERIRSSRPPGRPGDGGRVSPRPSTICPWCSHQPCVANPTGDLQRGEGCISCVYW